MNLALRKTRSFMSLRGAEWPRLRIFPSPSGEDRISMFAKTLEILGEGFLLCHLFIFLLFYKQNRTFLFPYLRGKEKEKVPKEKGSTQPFSMPFGHNQQFTA